MLYNILLYWVKAPSFDGCRYCLASCVYARTTPDFGGCSNSKKALRRLSSKVCFEQRKTFLAAQFRSHVQSSNQAAKTLHNLRRYRGRGHPPFEPSQKEMSVPPKIFILQKSTLTVNDPLQYQNYLLSLHQLSKQATRAYISPPGFVGSFFVAQNNRYGHRNSSKTRSTQKENGVAHRAKVRQTFRLSRE